MRSSTGCAGFASRYAQRKRERSALDFDDLELMTRDLLERDASLRERYAERFVHVWSTSCRTPMPSSSS